MNEDEEPKKRPVFELGQKLDDLSVDEIGEIVTMLGEEIERLQEAAKQKQQSLSAADAFFKK